MTRLRRLFLIWFPILAVITSPVSAQIVVIQGTDTLTASRTTINNNFSYLDTSKAKAGTCAANQVGIGTLIGGAGISCVALDLSTAYFSGLLPKNRNLATAMYTDQSNAVSTGTQDWRLAIHTMPSVAGTFASIPATCSTGEQYFATDKPAGQNIYGCTASNTWNLEGGVGGGATMAAQLGDMIVTKTSATIETICAGCSVSTPANVTKGYSLTSPQTCTLSGTVTSGTVYYYLTSDLILVCGHNTTATLTGSASITAASGIASVPNDALLFATTTFASNVWDAVTPAMDSRPWMPNKVTIAGTGLSSSIDPTTFKQTLSLANNSRTDVQNFMVGGWVNGGPIQGPVIAGTSTADNSSVTGPGTVSAIKANLGLQLNTTAASSFLMVQKKASDTWSAAAGTVDITVSASNRTGAPSAGNWNFNFYVGCANPLNASAYTYGSATLVAAVPPSALDNFSNYAALALNLPGSCVAKSPMEFWVQRVADTGGSTGVTPNVFNVEVVIRGN